MRLPSMMRRAVALTFALGCGAPRPQRGEAGSSPGRLSSARLRDRLPEQLQGGHVAELEIWQWLGLLAGVVAAYGIGFVLERLSLSAAARVAGFTRFKQDDHLVQAGRGPLRLMFFSLFLAAWTRWLAFPEAPQAVADLVARTVGIAS